MDLLLNTNIEELILNKIHGKVGRVGGLVNQIINYKNCIVEDLNISDGGFGQIEKIADHENYIGKLKIIKKYVKQEVVFFTTGKRSIRDRKTIIIDTHNAVSNPFLIDRYNNIISSNMIEHSPNPIFLLLNFHFMTKLEGHHFHAIPHYKYTYDCYRTPTTLEHMIGDFENQISFNDSTHNEDYINSAIVKHGWQKEFHEIYPVAYPYIHFHVFDQHNVSELFNLMFEDVTVDIIKTDEFSDNLILSSNILKSSFIKEYNSIIKKYSEQIIK
ncbi:MAG: hypothetical protein CVV49_03570 [Spirochaetae bacterium HGW-Spirochaetae-5]|nr:MAG: hypothetical protein CVV49_03570 [Spirochaetae bacterium HGW-Spirochaetae-5]